MYEVILYAVIATIICAMLYSVLGKPVGRGSEGAIDPLKILEKKEQLTPAVIDPIEERGDFPDIKKIRSIDPSFSLIKFCDAAQRAYQMVLEGFAEGDRDLLKILLTDRVYAVYAAAIDERENNQQTQITDMARLIGTDVTDVICSGSNARVSVCFEAEIASALKDNDGNIIQGDPDLLCRVKEIWSFERDLESSSEDWLLADVASSDGDIQETDPTPDTIV